MLHAACCCPARRRCAFVPCSFACNMCWCMFQSQQHTRRRSSRCSSLRILYASADGSALILWLLHRTYNTNRMHSTRTKQIHSHTNVQANVQMQAFIIHIIHHVHIIPYIHKYNINGSSRGGWFGRCARRGSSSTSTAALNWI